MKNNYSKEFEDAQYELYTYIDWLHNTGRITLEEHGELINKTADCVMKGISFGSLEGEEVE